VNVAGDSAVGRDRIQSAPNLAGPPTPGNGDIVRIDPSGARTTIVSGLTFPTGMTMGPDGNLWVSNKGFGPTTPGFGEILRINLN
jgi:sugar lactone lactonase YvrE